MGLPLPLLLALYALCYAPFSALTKVVGQPIAALPASLLGSCLAWGVYLVLCGDAGRRPRFDAQAIPNRKSPVIVSSTQSPTR